jgi:hypothetical protein
MRDVPAGLSYLWVRSRFRCFRCFLQRKYSEGRCLPHARAPVSPVFCSVENRGERCIVRAPIRQQPDGTLSELRRKTKALRMAEIGVSAV